MVSRSNDLSIVFLLMAVGINGLDRKVSISDVTILSWPIKKISLLVWLFMFEKYSHFGTFTKNYVKVAQILQAARIFFFRHQTTGFFKRISVSW